MTIFVLHENPDWYPPIASALDAEGLEHCEWLLTSGTIDLDRVPPEGVYWSRLSVSAHTRDHLYAKEYARALIDWLESYGRRIVNGRWTVEMEVSKVRQLSALMAFGIDVPKTIAVIGRDPLKDSARSVPLPFITKHNQGGKGLGVRRFDDLEDFDSYVDSDDFEAPVDGITLLQEYVQPKDGFITRVETVGYEFVYAISADARRGGFQLCPADACGIDDTGQSTNAPSLFSLREGFVHPIIDQYLAFARAHQLEVAGFEFLESDDGRILTYDINTNTNYNAEVEAVAPKSGPASIASYLRSLDVDGASPYVHPEEHVTSP